MDRLELGFQIGFCLTVTGYVIVYAFPLILIAHFRFVQDVLMAQCHFLPNFDYKDLCGVFMVFSTSIFRITLRHSVIVQTIET